MDRLEERLGLPEESDKGNRRQDRLLQLLLEKEQTTGGFLIFLVYHGVRRNCWDGGHDNTGDDLWLDYFGALVTSHQAIDG